MALKTPRCVQPSIMACSALTEHTCIPIHIQHVVLDNQIFAIKIVRQYRVTTMLTKISFGLSQ